MLRAKNVEPKQAVLWIQMQRDTQVAPCVDSTNRTVDFWWRTRQVLAGALYVGEMVRGSEGTTGDRDAETDMQRVRRGGAMEDFGAARGRYMGHTIQVHLPTGQCHRSNGSGCPPLGARCTHLVGRGAQEEKGTGR